jgi:multisubunit Na+/H+ antiporter MnhB subunit
MNSIILKTATRLVSALVLVLAVYLLWRGHHAPGGGFIAALVAATGFALVALSEGPATVRKGLGIEPTHLIGAGLCLAIGSGLVGLMVQRPFLSGVWWPPAKVVVGTPLIFDVGVFLVVLGAILTVLLVLEET